MLYLGGESSRLGSKSVSSFYLGGGGGGSVGSSLRQDKSFEEMRYEHLQEHPGGCPLTLHGTEGSCLPVRLLWILGRLLDSEHQLIRSTVMELVSLDLFLALALAIEDESIWGGFG